MQTGTCGTNPGKQLALHTGQEDYLCFALKTHLITKNDKLQDIAENYIRPHSMPGDIVFLSEKMVACTQGRAIPMAEIHPGFWAHFLHRFVARTPSGDGLGTPHTMQCAIQECGLPRILLASAAGALGKLMGVKGWFYHVAGIRAAAIDGPCPWTIPPYDQCTILAPLEADKVCRELSRQLGGLVVLVVDVNDLGASILGRSHSGLEEEKILGLLHQNPLGQSDQSTPIGILRRQEQWQALSCG